MLVSRIGTWLDDRSLNVRSEACLFLLQSSVHYSRLYWRLPVTYQQPVNFRPPHTPKFASFPDSWTFRLLPM